MALVHLFQFLKEIIMVTSLAQALEKRINQNAASNTGMPIGGVKVAYDLSLNNLTFTSGTSGDTSTFKVSGAQRFGLVDIPLGIGETAQVRTPVQATDELGRPLYLSPERADGPEKLRAKFCRFRR